MDGITLEFIPTSLYAYVLGKDLLMKPGQGDNPCRSALLTDGEPVLKGLVVNMILELEKQIERLLVEDFAKLAAWIWERAEDDALLRGCGGEK